MKQYVQMHIK